MLQFRSDFFCASSCDSRRLEFDSPVPKTSSLWVIGQIGYLFCVFLFFRYRVHIFCHSFIIVELAISMQFSLLSSETKKKAKEDVEEEAEVLWSGKKRPSDRSVRFGSFWEFGQRDGMCLQFPPYSTHSNTNGAVLPTAKTENYIQREASQN